jgi:hypothetical protein
MTSVLIAIKHRYWVSSTGIRIARFGLKGLHRAQHQIR